MIFISHRANLYGPDPDIENNPKQIAKVLDMGFDVEIDVWNDGRDNWYLGHDEPTYKIQEEFLLNDRLWCHAKNVAALEGLLWLGAVCFWHQSDDFVLTTNNFIWAYPGKELTSSSICVLPEKTGQKLNDCAGICTDFPIRYREDLG